MDSKAECDQLNLAHETKTNKKVVLSQRSPRDARYISVSNESLRYGHSKLSKMAACRQLGFDVIENSAMWNPHFGGRGGRRGSSIAPIERAMVVSYRLSIVTVALSVTIRPQFAIESLRRSNQRDGSLLAKISGCSPWSRPVMFGSAESEHHRLTNGKIIFEEFQPM